MNRRWLLVLVVSLCAWAMPLATVRGQEATTSTTAPEVSRDKVNDIARELWCPLCSGVRLDSCELKACEQMRQEIAYKIAAGEDLESIKADFVTQYGPQVLGEPPRQGFNWLAWILPAAVMLAGAIFLVVRGRSLFVGSTVGRAPPAPQPATQEEERLARQLDEELKRYG